MTGQGDGSAVLKPVQATNTRAGSSGDVSKRFPESWVIVLPWDVPPVKPNGGHGNIYAHAAKVKRTRQTMGLLARKAGIPWLGRCEFKMVWYVNDKRKRDADNLVWTTKALCDALAGTKPHDHRIVEDDTPDLMVKHMPEIVYRPGEPKQLVVTITAITRRTPITNQTAFDAMARRHAGDTK